MTTPNKLPFSVRLMQSVLGSLNASNEKHQASLEASERSFREANPELKDRAPINFTEGGER